MPKFSIIIPVYNVAPYLRECLDSVLAQTFTDWEAICVDDGSTDGSGAILDEYAAQDSRFRVIHQTNAGVSAARNAALDVTCGEWIGFLDADDILVVNRLACVADAISDGVDWIRAGFIDWMDGDIRPTWRPSPEYHEIDLVSLCEMISHGGFPFVNYIRRDIVSGITFPTGVRFREDAVFMFEVASRVRRCRVVMDAGYYRRCRNGSATFSPRHIDDHVKLCKSFVSMAKRVGWTHSEERRLVSAFTHWVYKDIFEWAESCSDRRFEDVRRAWWADKELARLGLIRPNVFSSLSVRIRWRLYLLTGFVRVFLISKNNIFGRRKWQM